MKGIRISHALAIVAVIGSAETFSGCNMGADPDLGAKLDTLTSIGRENATAWMRTDEDGHSELLVLGGSADGDSKRFVLTTFFPDMTGTLDAGTYTSTDERIVLRVESEYTKKLELDLPPISRTGSVREDFAVPKEISYAAAVKGGLLHLRPKAGAEIVMTEFWDVMAKIDLSADAGFDMLSRTFNLTTVSLQMRIPGFGGAGLLNYSNGPSEFVGAVDGASTIEMTSILPAAADIRLNGFQDFPGMVFTGNQLSTTDMDGNGNLTGTIHFTMKDPRKGRTLRIEGDLTYSLTLTNGTTSDGGYEVTLTTGEGQFVSWKEAENLDFRSILPPR